MCFFERPYSLLHVCATNMVIMQEADIPETETLRDVEYRRSQRLKVEGRKERRGRIREKCRRKAGGHGLCGGTSRTQAMNGLQTSREARRFVSRSVYQD